MTKGESFETLARKYSLDPGSGVDGGDLNWASPGSYVPEFSQAMTSLKIGEITPRPIATQFGFHIIKLIDKREPDYPSFDAMKEGIKTKLALDKTLKTHLPNK